MSARVTDTYKGANATIKVAKDLDGLIIGVGIHSEAGGEILQNAERHEFGLGVPARPFVSTFADQNQADVVARMKAACEAALKSRQPAAPMLDALAQRVAGDLQGALAGNGLGLQENAPATIAKKGSSVPLIDHGVLRSSISGKLIRR